MGSDELNIRDKVNESTLEINEAPSSTGYSGNTIQDDSDTLIMKNTKNEIRCTGIGDKSSKCVFVTGSLPEKFAALVARIETD